jgi:hypothetical protein
MSDLYTTTATITDKRTLILDKALPLAAGRVRVTIENLSEAALSTPFLVKLQAIHQMLADGGHQPHSKEVIDVQIRIERDSWGE